MDQALRIAARKFAEDPTEENALILASRYVRSAENLTPEYDIASVLTASTSHISAWEYETVANIWETAATEYGLWLHVISTGDTINNFLRDSDEAALLAGAPNTPNVLGFPNLMNLLNLARSLQCDWLLLDSHGPIINHLEVFDLEADVEVPQE